MSEADQRQKLIALLRPLHAISIENVSHAGTPDINYGGMYKFISTHAVYLEGWIECKWEKEWPKRGGPLRVPHYTNQQKVWARKRRYRGGCCYLMLQVGRDWILLDGEVAALTLGHSTREELIEAAIANWDTPPGRDELVKCLLPNLN